MTDAVNVVRYIRPFIFEFSEYGEHSNMYGITIFYTLDYSTQTVSAKWSICNNDNFSKKFGVEMAKNSNKVVSFDLDLVKKETGLTEALIVTLMTILREEWYPVDFEDTLNLFLKASRKLK